MTDEKEKEELCTFSSDPTPWKDNASPELLAEMKAILEKMRSPVKYDNVSDYMTEWLKFAEDERSDLANLSLNSAQIKPIIGSSVNLPTIVNVPDENMMRKTLCVDEYDRAMEYLKNEYGGECSPYFLAEDTGEGTFDIKKLHTCNNCFGYHREDLEQFALYKEFKGEIKAYCRICYYTDVEERRREIRSEEDCTSEPYILDENKAIWLEQTCFVQPNGERTKKNKFTRLYEYQRIDNSLNRLEEADCGGYEDPFRLPGFILSTHTKTFTPNEKYITIIGFISLKPNKHHIRCNSSQIAYVCEECQCESYVNFDMTGNRTTDLKHSGCKCSHGSKLHPCIDYKEGNRYVTFGNIATGKVWNVDTIKRI
jgi:hypothetical protein